MGRPIASTEVLLVFPHQLFPEHPGLAHERKIFLIEEPRFFFDPQEKTFFHKKKLLLLRAAMRHYASRLQASGFAVDYLEYRFALDPDNLAQRLKQFRGGRIVLADLNDDLLEKRVSVLSARTGLPVSRVPSPGFLTSRGWFEDFFREARHYSLTSFYIAQRRLLKLLVQDDKPLGGKWSFDPQNRKRMPLGLKVPPPPPIRSDGLVREARSYVEKNFPGHPGDTANFIYPFSPEEARRRLGHFIETGLAFFGDYQDAIRVDEPFLFHSLLSPALNIGLLTPDEVVRAALDFSQAHPGRVPLNALEGFIRQIVGWREFVRAVYLLAGERQSSTNFWNHHRPLPASFYSATTGMDPVDTVLRRVNRYGYAHHIERLMILGNFLLLCEVAPREVYRWFMEMFVDAYDWVMVPNVFGLSQYADGGLITTKPYISSSNYILKMSDFARGEWCTVWDGLYWRFIHRHRDFFARNPRLSVMASQLDRMGGEKLAGHLRTAEDYLNRLA
ncbi:MAG: cryptochrome/photolyase family protein [Desulfobacterota bacterium]|nr:cryptochrome/photolyase family protein [Thermodesulfobacteriota bacterium]